MTSSYLSVWPVVPPAAYVRRPKHPLPFPLDEEDCRLFSRARHGLSAGVRSLGLGPGDEVLTPAYHHGSEIEALRRAGVACRFYDLTGSGEPDEEALEASLSPTARALYLTHYLGFPQDARRWREWCDRRGLYLLEDAAQAWLATVDGRPVGSYGALAIFCLYKTFGLPDGGAVVSTVAPPGPGGDAPLGLDSLVRKHARVVAGPAVRWVASARPASGYDPAADFDLGDCESPPAKGTMFLLPRAFDPAAAARRRANYAMLLDELGELVSPPFRELPHGASPFAFPVEVDDKAGLLGRLEEHGVTALDFWSVPHPSLPSGGFPQSARRRRRTVALPVHQGLTLRDIARVSAAVRPPRRRRRRIDRVELAEFSELEEEWSRLAETTDNIFATWEWSSIWWRHFGREASRLLLAACRDERNRLFAILPLYLSGRGRLRLVRFLGHGAGDHLGPVCAAEDRSRAARALRDLLGQRAEGREVFLGEQLIAEEGWDALLGADVLRTTGFPILDFNGQSWTAFLGARSGNFRSQLRRKERRLADGHDVRYRLASDPDLLDTDLDTLFALHRLRWGATDSPFTGPREAFHRAFAAAAVERGWLRLWFLEVDGSPIAAWYGFRFQGRESYYQAGRDPSWDSYSVGFLLLMHSIRSAVEDGMREYRFLRGDEAYKYRFATRDPGLQILARGRGLAAGAAVKAGIGAYRLPALRELLRGPLGA